MGAALGVVALVGTLDVVGGAGRADASVSIINSQRASAGRPPLISSGGLAGIAQRHATQMAAQQSLYHSAGLGASVSSVHPGWTRVGENVGVGSSLSQVSSSFMASSAHRANILGDYTHAGVGAATSDDGRVWVTQVFAKVPGTALGSPAPVARTAPAARAAPVARASRGTARPATSAGSTSSGSESVSDGLSTATAGVVAAAPATSANWMAPPPEGYTLVGADGGVFTFGDAVFSGSLGTRRLAAPVTGLAPTATGAGYYLVGADGGVFAFGDAIFAGSATQPALRPGGPIVALSTTPSGAGYWLAAADGGVFSFGDARFNGSAAEPGIRLGAPVVGMAASASGRGYWLAAADGAVYAFGDARFAGSAPTRAGAAPVVSIAPTPTGAGYWLAAADGAVFAFGDAIYAGGASTLPLRSRIVAIVPSPTGEGYRLVGADGGVFAFGDAGFAGAATGRTLVPWRPAS